MTLPGWLPRIALARELQTGDCFLSLSRYEGMSNAMLEAMASGLPVVASKIISHEELIDDGVEGFLVALTEDSELEKVLMRLSRDPRYARLVGAKAREKVRYQFSWHASAKSYLTLLEQVPRRDRSKQVVR